MSGSPAHPARRVFRITGRGMPWVALAGEAAISLGRHPLRTIMSALGTVLAVGGFVALSGLTQSARNAVASSFNELNATTVQFQSGLTGAQVLTAGGVARLAKLHGVLSTGLLWALDNQTPQTVSTTPPSDSGYGTSTTLPLTAATPSTFQAIGARLRSGRFYDAGADRYHEMVAVLGSAAASQLGISSVAGSPAIFVDGTALTITGILSSTTLQSQVELGVIVPPYVATVISNNAGERTVITRTAPGAAQLIGKQGPEALAPYHTADITAEIPPQPTTLRAQVQASLSQLLSIVEIIGLTVGIISIGTVTLLSVTQRRQEIGLRRAIGYGRADIAKLILTEAVGTGALGSILGISVGVIAVAAVAASNGWVPILAPGVLIRAPVAGIAIGIFAGAAPAIRAATLTPMSALRT